MADNLACQEDFAEKYRSEMLDGMPVLMAPRPGTAHNRVLFNIAYIFESYLRGKKCEAFPDGTTVYLTEKDRVIPDVMIVCRRDIIKADGVHGAPDLIVEVLFPKTRKRDKGDKKDLYERCGVREYWIVSPEDRSVDVYLLKDGKFILDEVYEVIPDYIELSPEEQAAHRDSIPVSLFSDLSVPLEEIFRNLS